MTVRRGFKKLFLSTLIPCLVIASASLGGCSSEVGSAPSSKESTGKPVVVEEPKSERSKGSSKALENMKSIKSRVLGPGGEK